MSIRYEVLGSKDQWVARVWLTACVTLTSPVMATQAAARAWAVRRAAEAA